MRVSSFLALVFTVASASLRVSAAGTLGFAIGARHSGEKLLFQEEILCLLCSEDGSCKNQQDYEDDFEALSKLSPNPPSTPLKQLDASSEKQPIVRTYSQVDKALENSTCYVSGAILPAAQAKKFKVVIGLWYESISKA